jgi:hypothetical protein
MNKVFTHYGFQSSRSRTEIEEAMTAIGIKGFSNFDKEDDGLYYMSTNPVSTPDIGDYTNEELIAELEARGIDYIY